MEKAVVMNWTWGYCNHLPRGAKVGTGTTVIGLYLIACVAEKKLSLVIEGGILNGETTSCTPT